jgi:hypothetical protein
MYDAPPGRLHQPLGDNPAPGVISAIRSRQVSSITISMVARNRSTFSVMDTPFATHLSQGRVYPPDCCEHSHFLIA